jgi:uncharacterized lipoprotein YddW (UPF0748 family)
MNLKKLLFYILVSSIACLHAIPSAAAERPALGTWITVFSEARVMESRQNVDKMLDVCENSGISDIYLQIYRSDKAYYNSDIADRSPFEALKAKAGIDTVKYLLDRAHAKGIKVHAWLNMLCLSQNETSGVVKRYGQDILTKDEFGRTPLRGKGTGDALDKYYQREDQLFLEPGDVRVRKYVVSLAEEVIRKYPGFDGLHLDYIRYPAAVPFMPGARFIPQGLYYGYTKANLAAFTAATGLDPRTMNKNFENSKKWDDWHRNSVTAIVRETSQKARALNPGLKISCTTVASPERTYYVTAQDWNKWLKDKLVDYIVPMNYSEDPYVVDLNSRAMIYSAPGKKVYMGLGAYMLTQKPEVLKAQIKATKKLSPEGIVIFAYDDIAKNKDLQEFLYEEFGE